MKVRQTATLVLALVLALPSAQGEPLAANQEEGRMTKLRYFSPVTGVERNLNVYTPPFFTPSQAYPVVYVLHGIGGTENEWLENSEPRRTIDALIEDGAAEPMIVVFANGRAMAPDSVPKDPFSPQAVEAFDRFGEDLLGTVIPFIQGRFNVLADRNHRGLCGLSMGGGQALNIGLAHPGEFGWVGAFSPAPNTDVSRFRVDAPGEAPKVWILCGESDGLVGVSKAAARYLEAHQVESTLTLIPGNHDWTVWTYGLRNFLTRIF